MKDKVKRKRLLKEKKESVKITNNDYINPNDDYETLKRKQELQEQIADREKIEVLDRKIKLAKIKSKELNEEFKRKNASKMSPSQFSKKYKKIKKEREKVIKQLEKQLSDLKKEYDYKWETGNFKIKRWFVGMGKEFSRISWANKKSVWISFIVVVVIVLILATIFLGIDRLFSI